MDFLLVASVLMAVVEVRDVASMAAYSAHGVALNVTVDIANAAAYEAFVDLQQLRCCLGSSFEYCRCVLMSTDVYSFDSS